MLFPVFVIIWMLCGAFLVNSQAHYSISGVKVNSGATVPLRKNINDLQAAGGPQWDLYIRALAVLYKQDPNDQLSFFQVAGVHGKPYIEWNGAGPKQVGSSDWQGYCPHGEDIFLPWHRPYLLLFEQRLVETATKLASQYPQKYRAQYTAAASSLRAPYWDWAAGPSVPPATIPAKMAVKVAQGTGLQTIQVDNPLATYKFPKSAVTGAFGPFDSQDRAQIYRCPSPQSYPGSANNLLSQSPYKQWVYDAFTYTTTFKEFASTSSSGISLEQIHNNIHWDGACGGQFLDADFAGFDPLFMLHHANVDRLWTYWQFIRPTEALFAGSYRGLSRFSTPDGTSISTNSPLQPFFTQGGGFHTPKSVQSIKSFGYTYQGLEYWQKSDQQLKQDATALINQLYATGVSGRRGKRAEGSQDEITRYFVQISVDVEELSRPCSITIFVKDQSVGRLVVLKQPQSGIVNGELPIDQATNSFVPLKEVAKPQAVVPALLSDLRVRIMKVRLSITPDDCV
ncbi:Fc.00g105560.m01.CDS01 [Cosmosporella sp. VM-42]